MRVRHEPAQEKRNAQRSEHLPRRSTVRAQAAALVVAVAAVAVAAVAVAVARWRDLTGLCRFRRPNRLRPRLFLPHTAGFFLRTGMGLLRTNGEDAVVEEVRVWPGDGPQIVTAQQRREPPRGKRREEICGTYSE